MANLTNSAKLINEMSKKADKTELPAVYDSTVTVVVNGNTGTNTFSTNQAANSTLKVTVGKSDVGLGNVDNTSDANKPISTATQAALDLKADKSEISTVFKYKGSKANYDALPASGNVTGDVWNVEAAHTTAPIFPAGSNLAWDGSAWDVLGGTVDLSNYLAKDNTTSFTPTGDYNPATKKYVDDNIETYNAGTGISISDVTINGRRGPAPEGFHVPSKDEWQGVISFMDSLSFSVGDDYRTKLHMPFAGTRGKGNGNTNLQGSYGHYWSSSPYGSDYPDYANYLFIRSSSLNNVRNPRAEGFSIRCFKDEFVSPTSSWTVIAGTLGIMGIFRDQENGLISIVNGESGYTMQDKNLGATVVYSDGDTLSEANCGYYYQRGNNYGFAWTGSITTSSTQVNASSYGPNTTNGYYSSNTFITGSNNWDSSNNDNLWGDTTGAYTINNAISNTGVTSVNGQTGDITGLVGSSNNTINNVVHLSQADYDALQNPDSNTWYSTPDSGSGGFDPENAGSVGQVVTKTATGYAYADAPVKSVNGQTGDVTINTPEGEGIRIFKLTTDTPDSTTMAAIAEAIRGSVNGTSASSDLVNRIVYPVYIERATDNYDSEELAYNRNRKIYRLTSYNCSAASGFETANFVCDTGGTIVYYLTIQGVNIASSGTYTYSSQWQVISGDNKKYTIKTSSTAPASGTSNSIITFVI